MRYLIALLLFAFLPIQSAPAQVEAPTSAVEITEWKWHTEPDFGTDGAIRWVAQVKNTSDRTVYQADIKITLLDEDGSVVNTDVGLVQNVRPGGVASAENRADLYGTEEKARIRVIQVYYE